MPIAKWMSEAIAKRAVHHRFHAEADALEKRARALALDVYTALTTPEQRAAFQSAEKWMETLQVRLRIQHRGLFIDIPTVSTVNRKLAGVYVPYQFNHHVHDLASLAHGGALMRAVEELTADVGAHMAAVKSAHIKLEGMLQGFRSVKDMQARWPEGEPFYKEYVTPKGKALPVVQTDAVNTLFGLPIDSAT